MSFSCTQAQFEAQAREQCRRFLLRGDDLTSRMPMTFVACSAQERWLELSHEVTWWELNLLESLHGGVIAWLLDTGFGLTLRAFTGDHLTLTTNLQVSYLRPIRQGQTVIIRSRITHLGRTTAQMTSELWTEDPSRPCATASATFYRGDSTAKTES